MNNSNSENRFLWLKNAQDIIALGHTEVPTLLTPLIAKVGAMALAGSSDLGKSYFLLQLMVAIVKRHDSFLGFPLNVEHGRAIYLSTEDDEYSLCPRLINLSKQDSDIRGFDNLMVLFETKDLIDRLDEVLTSSPCDLVVVDTFSDIYEGDLNQANKVRTFIQRFKELANKYKTMFIFNHHCGKKNDFRPPHKDNLLGSQGFESSMRTVIELRKDFDDSKLRHMCVVKGNYIGEEYKTSSFELEFDYENGFRRTGRRVSFDSLVKNANATQAEVDLTEKILALRASGMSITKIHETVNQEGVTVSRSKVGIICKENASSIQLSIDNEMDGQRDGNNSEDDNDDHESDLSEVAA